MKGQDELGFDVDPFEKAFGQLAGPVHWPSLTETERLEAFADLREWVEQFADRFVIEVRSSRRAGTGTTGWSRHCPPCAITSECRSPITDPRPARSTGSGRSGRSRYV